MDFTSQNDVLIRLVRFLLSKMPFRTKASSQWQFTSWESRLHESGPPSHDRQYALLKQMKEVWRRDVLEVPHTWLLTDINAADVNGNIAHMNLGFALNHCTVSQMTTDAVIDRHNTADCVAPDFCLTKQRSGLHPSYYSKSDVNLDPPERLADMFQNCTQTASDIMMYDHDEALASFSVSGIFIGIPGCSMTRNTRTCLPPSLMPVSTTDDLLPVDFAVLANPISSSSPENLSRDKALYISVTRPALLYGMKGPMGWPNDRTGKSLQELIADMAVHAEASLDIINEAWQDRHRDDSSICPPLPDDAMIFGILYDSSQMHIIAHILEEDSSSAPKHYISYLVDSLEFPANPDGQGAAQWFTGRLRVLVALLTLQRHVYRLGSLWGETACSSSSDVSQLSMRLEESEKDPNGVDRLVFTTHTLGLLDALDDFVMGPDHRRPDEPSDKDPAAKVTKGGEDEEEEEDPELYSGNGYDIYPIDQEAIQRWSKSVVLNQYQ